MAEYREFRCCMCPNVNEPEKTDCPAGQPCRFVKTYVDARGWKYRVMAGIGSGNFKPRYQKPGKSNWKCVRQMPWFEEFDTAQIYLNGYANGKGWREYDG